jgi:hypothetical protein
VDQEIELAEPNFVLLAPEETGEVVRLLAALIRAARAPASDSPDPRPESPSPEDLADGSPSAPQDIGEVAPRNAAGGGR